MPNSQIQRRPGDLPTTTDELTRKVKSDVSFNDQIEALFKQLLSDNQFHAFVNGCRNEDYVEGTEAADDHEAARMIRTKAKELYGDDHPVALAKLDYHRGQKEPGIIPALRVALRRWDISRKARLERANSPGNNNSN
jgi:hypothetical protein